VAENPERGKAHGRNDRRHRKRVPTTRTDHGSEAQKPDRHQAFRSTAPAIIYYEGGRSPRRKSIGARTRDTVNRQVGPDKQKCFAKGVANQRGSRFV